MWNCVGYIVYNFFYIINHHQADSRGLNKPFYTYIAYSLVILLLNFNVSRPGSFTKLALFIICSNIIFLLPIFAFISRQVSSRNLNLLFYHTLINPWCIRQFKLHNYNYYKNEINAAVIWLITKVCMMTRIDDNDLMRSTIYRRKLSEQK